MAQTNAQLKATTRRRSGSGALKAMRREGFIPGVLYGKTQENMNIKVSSKEFRDLLKASASEHILVDLDVEGDTKMALIQQIQHDPLNGNMLHADFHAVSATEKLTATVPIEVVGDCPGIKEGGILEAVVHELQVTCLPKDLPSRIEIDVSSLELDESIHVGEIEFPEGVTPVTAENILVVIVAEPRLLDEDEEEEGIEGEEGEESLEPEVLREKKADEEEQS